MYIHDELFNPMLWNAPGRSCRLLCDASNRGALHAIQGAADASNPNQVECNEGHRWLQKKTIADVVEAFIGAHLVDGGPEAALAFMEWAGIPAYFDSELICEASSRCVGDTRCIQGKDLSELERLLGYSFENKSLLVEALTHPSFQVPYGNCYQVTNRTSLRKLLTKYAF
jgi:endoribonuclease Dicer